MDRVFFLHVPKTGGSSLTAALAKKFASWEIFPWHHSRLDLFDPSDLMKFRFFHGHFTMADFDYIPKPARIVTLLREPRARILSLYHYWRSFKKDALPPYEAHHSRVAKSVGLNTFLGLPNPSLRVAMDNALVQAYLPYPLRGRNNALTAAPDTIVDDALEALNAMTAFGILERFNESIGVIGEALKTPVILPTQKVRSFESLAGSNEHEPVERETPLLETSALLDSRTEIDRLFYDRACALFDRKFGQQRTGGSVPSNAGAAALAWGDWINFGAASHLDGVKLAGWSGQEEWGVWSITDHPAVKLGPLPKPTGPVRLTFALRAAIFDAEGEQSVTVLVRDRPIESWSFAFDNEGDRRMRMLTLPQSAVDDDGYLTLTFRIAQPVSPFAAGVSEDRRELGIGIENIHCECLNRAGQEGFRE